MVALYSLPEVAKALAFRGGTALHKLVLPRPGRYSEDIDLVQIAPGPIGPVLDAVREALDPWLGAPGRKQTAEGATLLYRFESSGLPAQPMRLKVEINTREHGSQAPLRGHNFAVGNPWFEGSATVMTYAAEELLGTVIEAWATCAAHVEVDGGAIEARASRVLTRFGKAEAGLGRAAAAHRARSAEKRV